MTAADARGHVLEAARLFNSGHYFEAHEVLEDALESVPEDAWELFVGLVRIAVGYHKVTQHLWSGAARMLELGLRTLAPFPDDAAGVRLAVLRQRVQADLDQLRAGTFDGDAFMRRPPRLQPLRG